MKRIIYLLVLSFFLNMEIQGQDIFRIKFAYGDKDTSLPLVATCSVESFSFCFEDELNFLTTYDKRFINKFSVHYKKLQVESKNNRMIIPQIMIIIDYNGSIPNDTICLGKYHGICKKGFLMKDNKALLNLIKKKIGWKSKMCN